MIIRIIKDWNWPDIYRQTPNNDGVWKDFRFTTDPVKECDYILILNRIPETIEVVCDKKNIATITQEPPIPAYKYLRWGLDRTNYFLTQDVFDIGKKFIRSQPAIPWHVNKDYDFLKKTGIPQKIKDLSWITSNLTYLKGHKKRMKFLSVLRTCIDFDLWGKGFNFIEDKWDGIAPYKYSLAVENHSCRYYWTEKLADCFLSWTMPIYYGCKNIFDYFPKESMIRININKPMEAIEIIKEAIAGDYFTKNIDAIRHARELILDKYQFFPYFYDFIMKHKNAESQKEHIFIKELPRYDWEPLSATIHKKVLYRGKRAIFRALGIWKEDKK